MYCKKCGRYLNGNADLCEECKEKEVTAYVENEDTGFGKALAGTITGVIGYIFMMIAFCIFVVAIEISAFEYLDMEMYDEDLFELSNIINFEALMPSSIVCMIIGAVLSVFALVFGIKSIAKFKQCVKMGMKKPVATLVLGIVGVASSVLTILFLFINLIMTVVITAL